MLITNPLKKQKLTAYTESFASQLRSALPTVALEMGMECQKPSQMQSLLRSGVLLPLDDSRQWIPASSFDFVEVPPGEEGCDVLIEYYD